jgi:hypothetical protein
MVKVNKYGTDLGCRSYSGGTVQVHTTVTLMLSILSEHGDKGRMAYTPGVRKSARVQYIHAAAMDIMISHHDQQGYQEHLESQGHIRNN